MKPAPFRYARPTSLADAVGLLTAGDHEATILAGGQSLVPMLNMRLVRPAMPITPERVWQWMRPGTA